LANSIASLAKEHQSIRQNRTDSKNNSALVVKQYRSEVNSTGVSIKGKDEFDNLGDQSLRNENTGPRKWRLVDWLVNLVLMDSSQ
jgi:hypothetical protein